MIRFHYSFPGFRVRNALKVRTWLEQIAKNEKKRLSFVDFVFVDDESILELNRQSLQHDYYTDIITFPYNFLPIEGEIYISVDRVRANGLIYKTGFRRELHRVMAHGLLHLCGYEDKTIRNKLLMTAKEDYYLALF